MKSNYVTDVIKEKFIKENKLEDDEISTLFKVIETYKTQIELLNRIIREKRHQIN